MTKLKYILQFAADNPSYFLTQILRRVIHKFNVLLPFTYSFSLKKLWIVLTYRCNLRCKMCGQWGEKGRSKYFTNEVLRKELELDELKKVIDEVEKYKPTIMLLGGEPLLYKEFEQLAEYIKSKKLRLELTTNGLLIDKFVECIAQHFDSVNISLDGPSRINDEIRGLKGGYEIVMNNIKKLTQLVSKLVSKKKLYLNICCTICEDNFNHLHELVTELENSGIEIHLLLFQHLEFINEEILHRNKIVWKEYFNIESEYWAANCREVNKVDINGLIEQVRIIRNYNSKVIKFIQFEPDFNEEEITSFYNCQNLKRFNNKCYAPYLEAFIYPEGNVWTCPGLVMGNVKEERFTNIWNNNNYRKLREYLNKNKYFPVCFRCANHWHNVSA